MDAYLTPALLAVLIGVVGWYGRRLNATVSTLCQCHLRQHPEDLGKFTIGG